MFDRFSDEAIKVIMLAQEEATRLSHENVGSEHILVGLYLVGAPSISYKSLSSLIDFGKLRQGVERIRARGDKPSPKNLPFSADAKQALHHAFDHARNCPPQKIDSGHMLLALLENEESIAVQLLKEIGIDRQVLRQFIIYTGTQSKEPNVMDGSRMTDREARELLKGCSKVVDFASEEARKLGHHSLGTELILLGLAGAGGSVATALEKMGVTPEMVRDSIVSVVGTFPKLLMLDKVPDELPFSPRAKQLIDNSMTEAIQLGHDSLCPRHLLLGLLHERDCVAFQVMKSLKLEIHELRNVGLALFEDVVTTEKYVETHPKFEKHSETSVNVMDRARDEALRMEAVAVDLEHVLLGLLSVGDGIAYLALKTHRLHWKEVQDQLRLQARDKRDSTTKRIWFSESVGQMLARADELSQKYKSEVVDTEHLLLALLELKNWRVRDVLDSFGHEVSSLRSDVETMMLNKRKSKSPKLSTNFQHRVDRFDDPINRMRVIDLAQAESGLLGQKSVGTEGLLLGILKAQKNSAAILERFGVTLKLAQDETIKIVGQRPGSARSVLPFTPRAKQVLELSWLEAKRLNHSFISSEHILLGLIAQNEGVAVRVLQNLKVDLLGLRKAVRESFSEGDDEGSTSGVLRR